MPQVVFLAGIERHLKIARDSAAVVGETKLAYFIDLAILEAKAVGIERKANEDEEVILQYPKARQCTDTVG